MLCGLGLAGCVGRCHRHHYYHLGAGYDSCHFISVAALRVRRLLFVLCLQHGKSAHPFML